MNKETYCSAGVKYKLDDLYGYLDSLIRSRVSSAYKYGCDVVLDNQIKTKTVMDLGSCHGHGVKQIKSRLEPDLLISSDRWCDFLKIQKRIIGNGDLTDKICYLGLNSPNLPMARSSLDGVFALHMIEHVDNPFEMLRSIKRIVGERGWIILATPNLRNIVGNNRDDINIYTGESLGRLLDKIGNDLAIFYINADEKAMKVHQRKKWLATNFPMSGELRKKINWVFWDKVVLRANLTQENFLLSNKETSNSIDILALVN